MNNFLDKFKKGVSDAGNMAKTLVDINKIKIQISQKDKEIETCYKSIGETVFNAFSDGSFANIEELVLDKCNEVIEKLEQKKQLNQRIEELSNEKECVCGKTVPIDTKFCPHCGYKFDEVIIPKNESKEAVLEEEKYVCSVCNAEVEAGAKYCPKCGNPM